MTKVKSLTQPILDFSNDEPQIPTLPHSPLPRRQQRLASGARSKRRPPRTRPAFFPPPPGRIRPPPSPSSPTLPLPDPAGGARADGARARARSRAEEGDGGGDEDGVAEVEAGRAPGQGSARRSKLAARAGGEVSRSAGQGSPRRGKLAAPGEARGRALPDASSLAPRRGSSSPPSPVGRAPPRTRLAESSRPRLPRRLLWAHHYRFGSALFEDAELPPNSPRTQNA
ncbi:uncharacterized protein [Miscanthus floridulus]|uniref:uncharacterized protein n=1 Tax=Miscanthus floridulus TaxID=154761 RepID=UPI00345A077A